MKKIFIQSALLIGLSVSAQTAQDSTVFFTSSQAETFLKGGSLPTGIYMTEGGGFKLHDGVTFGFSFKNDLISFTIEETGVVYNYDLVPNSVRYKTKDGFVKVITRE